MNRMQRAAVAVVLWAAAAMACAGAAAEPGVARLDVATGPTQVTLQMDVPLDSLLGFDHAPRTDEERRQADLLVTRLRTPGALFRIDGAAHCTPGRVNLQSAELGLGAAGDNGQGRGSVVANYDFVCKDGLRAGFFEIGLFDFFARLQRVDVQTTTRRGQLQARLKRPVTRVPLAR